MEKVSQLRAGLYLLRLREVFPPLGASLNTEARHLKCLAHKMLIFLFSVYSDRLGTDSL